jgi:hypothetical protein
MPRRRAAPDKKGLSSICLPCDAVTAPWPAAHPRRLAGSPAHNSHRNSRAGAGLRLRVRGTVGAALYAAFTFAQ